MYHKSSQISLVVDTDTWTSANLQQYDEYFDHPWLCYIQFCRNFQVGKKYLKHGPAELETFAEDVMEKNSILLFGSHQRCSESLGRDISPEKQETRHY